MKEEGDLMARTGTRTANRRKKRIVLFRKLTVILAALLLTGVCVLLLSFALRGCCGDPRPQDTESGDPSAPTGEETPPGTEPGTDPDTEPGTDPGTEPETDPGTEPIPVIAVPEVSFRADLGAYERYMDPQGEERDAYLILVNPAHPLSASDDPADLTDLVNTRKDGRNTQKMRLTAARALEALYLEADAWGMLNDSTGYELSVTSAFRGYSYQEYLFNSYVESTLAKDPSMTRSQAEAEVATYSCRPGTSEHQTGLCCDMHNQQSASVTYAHVFAETEEGKWLTENCWKFGFVLRFPEDKTGVTGISYESWHFRFVGRYHAYRMTELGMCLEEYLEYLSNNGT